MAVVGAGNGDTLPLRRIAARTEAIALIDIDPRAAQGARRRLPRAERRKVEVIGHDVTEGAADAIVRAAVDRTAVIRAAVDLSPAPRDAGDLRAGSRTLGRPPEGVPWEAAGNPLPGAPYDLVIGDLFYSQLLYPALRDLGVEGVRIDATIAVHGPSLTRLVVARLHASAPLVVHVHDPLAWWDGHEQPVSLEEVLALAGSDGPEAALALVGRGSGPHETDPRPALADLGLVPTAIAIWHWPFTAGVEYLACATLVGAT